MPSQSRTGTAAARTVIFLAGFTFLLYEVSWHRLLSLVLGATVTAATIVLAAFMAGFGAGAYILGRAADRRPGQGRMLAVLLAGLGLFNALDYVLITRTIPRLYASLAGGGLSPGATETLVFAFAALLLFVPAFLMGGVFPLISKAALGGGGSITTILGRLYALETLGSAVGGLVTGFVLLGVLGQRDTIFLAVAANLALGSWVLASGAFGRAAEPAPETEPHKTGRKARKTVKADPAALRATALVGAFACGFCILALQVLWLRMFRIYLTNTSYTFALITSLVILGMCAGSSIFARRGRGIVDRQRSMYRVLLLLCVATGLGLLLLVKLPEVLMFPFQSVLGSPLARVLLLPCVAALLIVFPPAVCSGFAFPLACRMYTAGRGSIGGDVGVVLMVNTAGAVLGPVAAAFVLLPTLGAGLSVLLVVALLAGAALYSLHRRKPTRGADIARPALVTVLAVLVVVIVVGPDIRILPPSFSRFDRDVLFYRESVEGTLSVGRDRGARTESKYTFVNNSAVIGSTYDAIKVVKMVGHFPFLLGLDCRDVLVIGFGIGVTTSAIASHPEVASITCVELVTGLKDAAVYYRDLNRNVTADPRLEIVSGDGR
ncbi:fused MFS/spermidine synthase, partial [bacterium]|nr:fused MFS/spermidine synthase [bacterium]